MRSRNKNRGNSVRRPSLSVQGKPAGSGDVNSDWDFKEINAPTPPLSTFRPLPTPRRLKQRSYSTHSSATTANNEKIEPFEMVFLSTTAEGKIQVTRHQKEKEKNPDRICLDKRGITSFPIFVEEGKMKLLSLQHNLINKIEDVIGLKKLVFLDLYNNQLGAIESLDSLLNLRVLLLGKNRIQQIEGLDQLQKLEVLDLHGNQICKIDGLSSLHVLKVLNLASNQIRCVEKSGLQGLHCLKELNLRRNRIKQLTGFQEIPDLQKLYVSNNDISSISDIHDVANGLHIQELTVDGNPVSLSGDCVYFLVAYLGKLKLLNQMEISEDVKKSALEWRKTKASLCKEFASLKIHEVSYVQKQEVISKARIHWKLLRSQAKLLVKKESEMIENMQTTNKSENIVDAHKMLPERPSSVPNSLHSDNKGLDCDQVIAPASKSGDIKKIHEKNFSCSSHTQFHGASSRRVLSAAQRKRQNFSKKSVPNSNDSQPNNSSIALFGPIRLPPILAPFLSSTDSSTSAAADATAANSLGAVKNCLQLSLKNSTDVCVGNFFHPLPVSALKNQSDCRNHNSEQNMDSSLSSLVTDSSSDSSSEDNGGGTSTSCLDEDSDLHGNPSDEGKLNSKDCNLSQEREKKLSHRSQIRIIAGKNKQKISVLPSRTKEQGGDYLIEIEDNCLNIYGQGALRHIDKPWNPSKAGEVSTVKFNYISFNSVAVLFGRIKQLFPNVEHFHFKETNIYCLGQINALAEAQGLTSLQIDEEGNPITLKNWRSYAVFRLYHWGLRNINGSEVLEEELAYSSDEYKGLSDIVLCSLPDSLLLPLLGKLHVQGNRSGNGAWSLSPKDWLWKVADPALRDVVSKEALQWRRTSVTQEDIVWRQKAYNHFGQMLDMACSSVEKLKLLEKEWPAILNELIKNTLVDYSQLESYMKKRMLELKLY